MKNSVLAKRYAAAIFELACQHKIELKVEEDLLIFQKGIRSNKNTSAAFSHPLLGVNEKMAILKSMASGKVEKLTFDFLTLLAAKKRLDLLDSVLESYHELLNESRHFEEVEMTTARPLSSKLKEALEKILEKKMGEKIISKIKVDPSFIGGISVRIRNRLYDGSVRTQLNNLKLLMVGES